MVAATLALWELVVGAGILSESQFPTMSATLAELFDEIQTGQLLERRQQHHAEVAALPGIAIALAIPIGIGSSRLLYRATRVVIEFLRPIPVRGS